MFNTLITLEDLPSHLKPIFSNEEGKSGIYVVLSKTLKRGYVGMSRNLMWRWLLHYELMTTGMHNAKQVQEAFDQYGVADFSFKVLEYVPAVWTELIKAENKWKKLCLKQLLNNPEDCKPSPVVRQSRPAPVNKRSRNTLVFDIEYRDGKVYSYTGDNGQRVVNRHLDSK